MHKALWDEFENKSWTGKRGKAPRSGPGSTLARTENLRQALPDIFDRYQVKRFLDAPCGDWNWMQHVDLSGVDYIGGDIAKSLVESNNEKFAAANREFIHLDISSDQLPAADMMMCRECLFHLKWYVRWEFFHNFLRSKIPFLVMTICHVPSNRRLMRNGGYAPFNPMVPPFNFADPLEQIVEAERMIPTGQQDDDRADRSMGIWSRDQVADAVGRRAALEQKTT